MNLHEKAKALGLRLERNATGYRVADARGNTVVGDPAYDGFGIPAVEVDQILDRMVPRVSGAGISRRPTPGVSQPRVS